MSAGFTPGPWWIDRDRSAFPLAIRAALDGDVDGDTGQHLVVGGDLVAALPADNEADANLIAAAPDLLSALEKFVGSSFVSNADIELARAAIAKARGTVTLTSPVEGGAK